MAGSRARGLPVGSWERIAVEEATESMGRGWEILSPELREALVCRRLVMIAMGQCEETMEKNPALAHLASAARAALAHVNPEGR